MAKKLTLKIESLRIERFEVQPAADAARGTVHGFETQPCGPVGTYTEPYRFCYPAPISEPPGSC